MAEAFVVDVVRSPMGKGKPGGALSSLHAVELLAQTLSGLLARHSQIDPGRIDDVLIGCVSQAGEQASTPGRMAWLAAGFPAHVPSTTIDRRCGSSQQAMAFAAHAVQAGAYDLVIAGGVESMSRVPMGSARMGMDPFGPSVTERYSPGLVSQGVSAELVAAKWNLDREALDRYSARSHERAQDAATNGHFESPDRADPRAGSRRARSCCDETIRPGTTVEKLGTLKAAFETDESSRRFPEIDWQRHGRQLLADHRRRQRCPDRERASGQGVRPHAPSTLPLRVGRRRRPDHDAVRADPGHREGIAPRWPDRRSDSITSR